MNTRSIICGLTAGGLCAFGFRMTFVLVWPARYISDWSNLPGWVSLLGPAFSTLVIIAAAATYVLIGTALASLLGPD
jgi:hypothetical protein